MILQHLNNYIGPILNPNEDTLGTTVEEKENKLKSVVSIGVDLCQRNSPLLPEAESEALWFRLLDALVLPLRKLKIKRNRNIAIRANAITYTPPR